VGRRPNAIAAAGGDAWAVSFARNRLTRIDAASSRKLPGGTVVGVGGSDIAADGDDLWLTNSRLREVIRIDARNGRVTRRLRMEETPRGVATGERDLWIAAVEAPGQTTDTILRYDLSGRNRRDKVHINRGVQALAADRDGLWFAEAKAPEIRRFDTGTHQIKTVVNLPEPAYDLTAGEGYLWATLEESGTVERIDPTSGERTTIPAGPVPQQLVTSGGWVFVAIYGEHVVRVIDPRNIRVSRPPLPVGINPFAIAAADGHVWVTGQAEDTVTRIDY
jgi:streptogramin lyase